MVHCRICGKELEIETKDGGRYFRCPKCKNMCDSKESGSDIEVYKWAFKKWQFNEMKENIEYAAEPILQIPLVIKLAKELGQNDQVKKLQENSYQILTAV